MIPADELGVYVHFPFCARRCPYCDFRVDVVRDIPHQDYQIAVLTELDSRLGEAQSKRTLRSIYFGGGTPSLWDVSSIGSVVNGIKTRFVDVAPTLEVTVEANPVELTPQRCEGLVAVGVNRLSIGVQSFDDDDLSFLGRRHSGAEARRALDAAVECGMQRLSFDLINALPGRDLAHWEQQLDELEVYRAIGHLSIYELTIHAGTPFGRHLESGRLKSTDPDLAAAIYESTVSRLSASGRGQYEVSNFARPGHRAVHNSLYWTGADYIGLGVGAASLEVGPLGAVRLGNQINTAKYLTDPAGPPAEKQFLDNQTFFRELLYLGLRTKVGVDVDALGRRCHVLVPALVSDALEKFVADGLLERSKSTFWPTPRGFELADYMALRLV